MTDPAHHAAARVRNIARSVCMLALTAASTGCFGYRVIRPDEIEVPSYEPRAVIVPDSCDVLIQRAATAGTREMQPDEVEMVGFCQNQQILRAQEEEAAARKLEAHAEAASFALRVTTLVVGGLIAVLAWAL